MLTTGNFTESPMSVKQINLDRMDASEKAYKHEVVSQTFYDLQTVLDPNTIYHIKETGKLYLGTIPLTDMMCEYHPSKYFISINKGKYEIFTMLENKPCFVCCYDDASKALEALKNYNTMGGHDKLSNDIYEFLLRYISKEDGIHETILNIMTACGYRDEIDFQFLHEMGIRHRITNHERDLNNGFIYELAALVANNNVSVFHIYTRIYNVFVSYNLFNDDKYKYMELNKINLSDEINKIITHIHK